MLPNLILTIYSDLLNDPTQSAEFQQFSRILKFYGLSDINKVRILHSNCALYILEQSKKFLPKYVQKIDAILKVAVKSR